MGISSGKDCLLVYISVKWPVSKPYYYLKIKMPKIVDESLNRWHNDKKDMILK